MLIVYNVNYLEGSVADPDLKDPHHFAGSESGSIVCSMDPDPDPYPDQNLAHFHHTVRRMHRNFVFFGNFKES